MAGKPLDPAMIAALLKPAPGRTGTRGPKKDITQERTINVWFKLNHHLCGKECEHRKESPTGKACFNPECIDPRDETERRGITAVAMVHEKYMCRYCFLDGWLRT